MNSSLSFDLNANRLSLHFSGELTLYTVDKLQSQINDISMQNVEKITLDLSRVSYIDTAAAIFYC